MAPAPPARHVRFGPFRLDLRSGELLLGSQPVKVPFQSIEILKALLEARGDLVTREELRRRLWPDDTFVDFEHSLNAAMRRLRDALGDSADTPQFIETLPRRGYRFIGEIDAEFSTARWAIVPARFAGRWSSVVASAAAIVMVGSATAFFNRSGGRHPEQPLNVQFTKLTAIPGVEHYPTLSPDGEWIAYTARTATGADILLQRTGARVPAPINLTRDSLSDDSQPAFSPDGEVIAFRSERDGGGIFLLNRDGVLIKRLTRHGFNPAWTPDGKHIVYVTETQIDPEKRAGVSELWRVEVATEKAGRILDGDCMHPSVSPHGYRVACWALPVSLEGPLRRNETQRDIITVRLDGSDRQHITHDAATDWNPMWAADGRHLFFASDRGGTMNLWRVQIDEWSGRPLTEPESVTTPTPWLAHLARSADGRRVAYTAYAYQSSVHRVGFDSTAERTNGAVERLTTDNLTWGRAEPSPDGTELVLWSELRQQDIYVMRADGSGLRPLTNDVFKDRMPRWSPDGKRIAFYSNRGGINQVWTIERDGSGLRVLARLNDGPLVYPLWSPDGLHLLALNHIGRRICIFDVGRPAGSPPIEVLPGPPDGSGRFSGRTWARDGQRIAGLVGGTIWIYSRPTKTYEPITAATPGHEGPVWLEDDRRLLYPLGGRIMLVDTQTKRTKEILAIDGETVTGPALSADGRQMYFLRRSTDADIWLMTFR